MSSGRDRREDRNPFQWKSLSAKNAEKNLRVCGRSSLRSTSMPNVMNSRWRSLSEGQMDDQMYCALRLSGSPACAALLGDNLYLPLCAGSCNLR